MSENIKHKMHIVGKNGDLEEWLCPDCGRRFLLHWPPEFKRTILEPGDETVIHVGGKSFAEFSDLLHLETGEITIDQHNPRLDVFEEWLKGREK